LIGAGLFLGQKGYIARLFNSQADNLQEFIIQNSAGGRAAYLFGALGAYDESPIAGVGLGASGFYIYDHMPDWAMTTVPDIARQFSPENRLYPNPKNMYVRLLAETGLVGFFAFVAFLFTLLGDALLALQSRQLMIRYVGIAGLFSWLAIGMYNVTQDSFATPNIWINFGILAGLAAAYALESQEALSTPGAVSRDAAA
jgi:O-antigen ligase